MTIRENVKAILHYENYDYMPVVHFGYWGELLVEWHRQGHITEEESRGYGDGNAVDRSIADKLGFDFCWTAQIGTHCDLLPGFEYKVIEKKDDGSVVYQNGSGLIEMAKAGCNSIPVTIRSLLEDRDAWEKLYKQKLQPDSRRYNIEYMKAYAANQDADQTRPFGIHVGSLYGSIRNMLGVEGISYLYSDDEDLYAEIIDAVGTVAYTNLEAMLEAGLRPDFAHYWEDICFKNGPLVSPAVFAKYVGPQYKRMTDLLLKYGTDIVSLDCNGCVDA
jgi:uroporphyrinogen decarboxylase